MKDIIQKTGLLSLICGFLTLFSCTANITGSLRADGGADISLTTALQPRVAAMTRRFMAAGGQEGAILNGETISESMSAAPGVASAVLRNTGSSSLEGQVRISRINDFLAAADGRGFFIFEQSNGGFCEINISRETSAEILDLLSPQISGFLTVLMAPIATGEELSKPEYLDLVSSFYSDRAISSEIAGSRIRASIDFPGTVTSVRGGTFSGRRAVFDIPLIDLLVLETPLVYEVRWR